MSPATAQTQAQEALGIAGKSESRHAIKVQVVDSSGSPIPGAMVSDDVLGNHPKGYQPPTYATDAKGSVRLVCATNSAGLSIRADGFFGSELQRDQMVNHGTNTVRLRRSRLEGERPGEGGSSVPVCEDLTAPATLSDTDIVSIIRTAVAAPEMRRLPRSLWFIRIEPFSEKDGLPRFWVIFALGFGNSYSAVVVKAKEGYRLESAGRDEE